MKLIIIGGGFGGLELARNLSNHPSFEIILIDKFNYHQFQPLFYQVATSGLDASNISFPIRKVFQKSKNIRFRMAEVEAIDHLHKKVITNIGPFDFDVLVIATGASTNYFGNTFIEANAFPMKSTVEALQLRHRILHNFEDALHAPNEMVLQSLLTVVIVGAGPTGVELSGAIADMRKYVLPKDYPELDFSKMKIYLLEGGEKVLGKMSEKASATSLKYLTQLGVTVLTKTVVTSYDGETVVMNDGKQIQSSLLIWAAGIKGNLPRGIPMESVASGNRIMVDRTCKVKGMEAIYAIGDVAYMEEESWPKGHPQVAPVAIQQANLLTKNLIKLTEKISPDAFELFTYSDKGGMATVGRNLAVVDVPKPKLFFKGFIAWIIWMGLHLMLILGVKNRFFVFCNWLYHYLTYDQNLRLIFKEFYKGENK